MSFANLRREYCRRGLSEGEVADDPVAQLQIWLDEALAAGVSDPTAMVLATATPGGRPSARVVLLKGLDARGLMFFTNYRSRKGRELSANPWAAVTFFWPELERQVRAEGEIALTSVEESDEYFRARPLDSQLAAWASDQSVPIGAGRSELEARLAEVAARFAGQPVPRPPHWGGYRLAPSAMEFWQGRPGRLHDRLSYARVADRWNIQRLAP